MLAIPGVSGFTLGLCLGLSEALSLVGVSVLGTSLVFHVLWAHQQLGAWGAWGVAVAMPGVVEGTGCGGVAGVPGRWACFRWHGCCWCQVSVVSRVSLCNWVPLVSGATVA